MPRHKSYFEKGSATGFIRRHIGPSDSEMSQILKSLDVSSLEELMEKILPAEIYNKDKFSLSSHLTEQEVLKDIKSKADKKQSF